MPTVLALAAVIACTDPEPAPQETGDTGASEVPCLVPGDCPLISGASFERVGGPRGGHPVITDLAVFRERLYLTTSLDPLGDWGATVYHTEDGAEFTEVLDDPTSQGYLRLRVIGDALYVPDGDPNGYDPSWIYRSTDGDDFPRAEVTGSVHTFDVIEYEGDLLSSNGMITGDGSLSRSPDGVDPWTEVESTSYSRLKEMVVFDGRLYAAKRAIGSTRDFVRWNGDVDDNDGRGVDAVDGEAITWRFFVTTWGRLYWSLATDRVWVAWTDDGQTWTEVPDLDGEFVSEFAEYEGNLYALGHHGLWGSDDGEGFSLLVEAEDTETFGPLVYDAGISVEATASLEVWGGELWCGSSHDGSLYAVR